MNQRGSKGARLRFCHEGVARSHCAGVVIGLATVITLLTQIIAADTVDTVVSLSTILIINKEVKSPYKSKVKF